MAKDFRIAFEEDKEILKEIKLAYPQKISEAEPLNIGG